MAKKKMNIKNILNAEQYEDEMRKKYKDAWPFMKQWQQQIIEHEHASVEKMNSNRDEMGNEITSEGIGGQQFIPGGGISASKRHSIVKNARGEELANLYFASKEYENVDSHRIEQMRNAKMRESQSQAEDKMLERAQIYDFLQAKGVNLSERELLDKKNLEKYFMEYTDKYEFPTGEKINRNSMFRGDANKINPDASELKRKNDLDDYDNYGGLNPFDIPEGDDDDEPIPEDYDSVVDMAGLTPSQRMVEEQRPMGEVADQMVKEAEVKAGLSVGMPVQGDEKPMPEMNEVGSQGQTDIELEIPTTESAFDANSYNDIAGVSYKKSNVKQADIQAELEQANAELLEKTTKANNRSKMVNDFIKGFGYGMIFQRF